MFLTRSPGRKVLATLVAVLGFGYLFEASILDSRSFTRVLDLREPAQPETGSRLKFTATAYCKGTTTASGVNVRHGIAAADPDLLPVGSVVRVDRLDDRYNGIYTVMDTGPKVQGRHVDIYIWSCNAALELGRRPIALTVLRLGWNPKASSPSMIDRLFRQREKQQLQPPPDGGD
ncbi:MAG: 3D domain-containing protein [Vicinamibacterales bacterium]